MAFETITLRPIRKQDYPFLEDIIRKTWKYDELSGNPKDARHMARLYLRACLRRASFSRVAIADDGQVVGVILAAHKRPAPIPALLRALSQFWATALLFSTKAGRQIGKGFQAFDDVDAALLTDCKRPFDAEICFFAVDECARGLGVGKKLFSAVLDFFKSEAVKSFYLFTDSSCSYPFYEKRGMQRLAARTLDFRPRTDYVLHMFLYGYELQ